MTWEPRGREWRVVRVNGNEEVTSIIGAGLREDYARRLIARFQQRPDPDPSVRLQFREPPPPRPDWETVSVAFDDSQVDRGGHDG